MGRIIRKKETNYRGHSSSIQMACLPSVSNFLKYTQLKGGGQYAPAQMQT